MKNQGRNHLASMGIYIFNKDLLVELMSNPDTIDFGKEIIPNAIEKHRVLSYPYEGYWTDIGNIDSFFEANIGLTENIPQFDLYSETKRIYTRARILPTSKISGTKLNNVVIAEGSIINASEIKNSVIGIRSRIGEGTRISNTYIMGNDFYQKTEDNIGEDSTLIGVGKNCVIDNAILDKNCSIGNDVKIIGGSHLEDIDNELYSIKDGVIVIKKGVIIPDGFSLV